MSLITYFNSYQLEKAKKKEAAFIVTFAKRELEIAELKVRIVFYVPHILLSEIMFRFLLLFCLSWSGLMNYIFWQEYRFFDISLK